MDKREIKTGTRNGGQGTGDRAQPFFVRTLVGPPTVVAVVTEKASPSGPSYSSCSHDSEGEPWWAQGPQRAL